METAISVEFVSLYAISRQNFINILANEPEDYQQFCMIKDNLVFNNDETKCDNLKKCISCDSINHLTLNCDLLQYIPDKEKIIKRHEFSIFQERDKNFIRKQLRTKNGLNFNKFNKKNPSRIQKKTKNMNSLSNFSHLRVIIDKKNNNETNFFGLGRSIDCSEIKAISNSFSSLKNENNEESNSFIENKVEKMVASKINLDILKKGNKKVLISLEEPNKKLPNSEIIKEEIVEEKKSEEINEDFRLERIKDLDSIYKSYQKNENSNSELILNKNLKNDPETVSLTKKNTNSTISNNNLVEKIINSKDEKKSINSNCSNYVNQILGFEKAENFVNYYPLFNVESVLKIYDKKRSKLAFLREFYPSQIPSFLSGKCIEIQNETKKDTLMNLGKYSSFAHHFKDLLSNNKLKNIKKLKGKEKGKNRKRVTESPFFKRKEFKKEEKFTLDGVVNEIIKMKNIQKKKKESKN